jgi:hypothetical protein
MKKLVVMLTLATSLTSINANALEVITAGYVALTASAGVWGTSSSIYGVDCAVGQARCKEAVQVLKDTQEFVQSGKVSVMLSKKILDTQAQDQSLSADEALDVIVADAAQTLNLK